MVNAQEWLDREYPKEEGSETIRLDISNKKLEGELDLSDFRNLEELNCRVNKITSLNLNNCLKLKILKCGFNKLTNLNLNNLVQLEIIDCSDNYLNNFDYSVLNPDKLTYLNISDNNLDDQDLTVFSKLTKLERLYIGGDNKEHFKQNIYNKFTGSLDCFSDMKQLKKLFISNTDINKIDLTKLPNSLGTIEYSTKERSNCKLTEIIPQLKKYDECGWCQKCQQPNTSKNWCHPCSIQEWQKDIKNLTGSELIDKFIQQQLTIEYGNKLKWIPYEEFTNIEYLTEGGFSRIYKAKWEKEEQDDAKTVALKILSNSQNITLEFLTEIVNNKLVDVSRDVVQCCGFSQDPISKNYVMAMDYMNEGNLREYLKKKNKWLSLRDKLYKLEYIVEGLKSIHRQNLVHQDLHSGNILNDGESCYITDLGLSKPVNFQPEKGQIYGVIPYVAPEVLRGQPYTQTSDVYSFGIIMYEMFSGSYPFCDREHDAVLAALICEGLRPQFQIKIPPLLEELIKRCWGVDPELRPNALELQDTLKNWRNEIRDKKNTLFTQQLQEAEEHNQSLPENIRFPKYEIHKGAVYTSKLIDTKQITELLVSKDLSLELKFQNAKANSEITDELDINCNSIKELASNNKRQLSLETQIKVVQAKDKITKMEEKQECYIEPLEIDYNWTNIHPSFTPELIQSWQNHNFTYQQVQDWINTGLQPTDYNFATWLRDEVKTSPIEFLNDSSTMEDLREQFGEYQFQIEQPPK